MGDVRLAGRPLLALVRGDGEVERPADRFEVGAGVLGRGSSRTAAARIASRSGPCAGRGPGADDRRTARTRARRRARRSAVLVRGVVLAIDARIRSAVAGPVQRGFGLGALVPRRRPVRADDRLLVALAGEQHDVAGAGALEGGLDRRAAVGDDEQVVVAALAGGLRAARDLVEDPSRSSPRGSSSVTTTIRARSPAIRPISGRLAVSRSPAEPKTAIRPPPPRRRPAGRAGRGPSGARPGCGRSRR